MQPSVFSGNSLFMSKSWNDSHPKKEVKNQNTRTCTRTHGPAVELQLLRINAQHGDKKYKQVNCWLKTWQFILILPHHFKLVWAVRLVSHFPFAWTNHTDLCNRSGDTVYSSSALHALYLARINLQDENKRMNSHILAMHDWTAGIIYISSWLWFLSVSTHNIRLNILIPL